MKIVRAAARRNRNGSAAIASLFGGRVVGRDLVLLYVVRIEAVEVRCRIGRGRFVGVYAVNRDVKCSVARAVDMNARSYTALRTLHHAGFKRDQVKWVATVERQLLDSLLLDHVRDGRVRSLNLLDAALNGYCSGLLADLHLHVDRQRRINLQLVADLLGGLESRTLNSDGVVASGQ